MFISTHPRRRTLVGLDERRMVVRLHLEHRAQTIPDIHRAGIFAGPLNHARPRRRQLLQVDAGALVGTMFAPHGREHAQFGPVGFSPQDLQDLLIFVIAQLMLLKDGFGNDQCVHE